MHRDNKFYVVTETTSSIFGTEKDAIRNIYNCKYDAVREACKKAEDLIEEAIMYGNERVSCFYEGGDAINLIIFGEEKKETRNITFTVEERELDD